MSHKRDICLVLLVGIPGSGKSFFRSSLEKYIKLNPTEMMRSVKVTSICYDDYCKVRNPINYCESGKWKDERRKVLKDVENIVVDIRENDNKNSRQISQSKLSAIEHFNAPNASLIVIDDNMYYKSMRYEYFKIARTYNLSFCQLFFSVTLDKAIKCNKQRCLESQIPEDVIVSMFKKIEPPDQSNDWERHSLHIASYINFKDKLSLNSIFNVIMNAISNPVVVGKHDFDNAEAQQKTNTNMLHQIDNILKQLVGTLMKNRLEEKDNCNVQALSSEYSTKRLFLLKQIKEGIINLPINISQPYNQTALNLTKPKLLELLKRR